MFERAPRYGTAAGLVAVVLLLAGCDEPGGHTPVLNWYVFDEPSGAFASAARRCAAASDGAYDIRLKALPSDADQQREQLVRRLAARDPDIDLLGMDVIWTAEFAAAGWILPWPEARAAEARAGRLDAPLASVQYAGRLWAAPFTTNAQLLWYRSDRVAEPPATWNAMIEQAEGLGGQGTIQAQGERYEGFTVLFTSLLASAGGDVLAADGEAVLLQREPALQVLHLMRRFARSPAAPIGLDNAREDQARLAFEAGDSSFMLNYTYVWPSAQQNAPEVARHMAWARWPGVVAGRPGRVTVGGINIAVGAWSPHPDLALRAASCIASAENQLLAARRGGLPPTVAALYDTAEVRAAFPFAGVLRATLRDAVQRPQTPLYNDVSLAISRTLHPMAEIEPQRDLERLRAAVGRALRSQGLM